ncbi:hypothetical protein FA95DRAFT_1504448 [Auriscalpium vulgare]|uniref:Uncharacterized protein n=1 Tax=Auriscalpium vulgare TaxID=40419 RepID=A0ACB8R6S5_9AGAM|nr:hypothetical protein FA95DRAFT_1504448 [Auriscalpium vulgare]
MEYLIDAPTSGFTSLARAPHDNDLRDRNLVKVIGKHLDKLLPFREKAPGVRRARTVHGPYAPEHARTRKGFFSALVFRTILFGSGYMFDHPIFFDQPDKLTNDHALMVASFGPKYFVDAMIYGSATNRPLTNVSVLWDRTGSSGIPFNFHLADPTTDPLNFTAFYRQVIRMEPSPSGGARRAYPQCGDLIGYLIAADYVYTGIVAMPDVDEMGRIIHHIAKGALSGLQLLELVDPAFTDFEAAKPPVQHVQWAFRTFFELVSSALTPEQRSHMGWDVITAEHTLCKISRLHGPQYRLLDL